jgi:hypothetical protein
MQESCSTVLQWPQSLFRVRQGSRLNFLKAIGASLSFLCAGISKLVMDRHLLCGHCFWCHIL